MTHAYGDVQHGTPAGYMWHRRHRDLGAPCRPCKAAWARYYRLQAANDKKGAVARLLKEVK